MIYQVQAKISFPNQNNRTGRAALGLQEWRHSEIGNGEIVEAVILAIEIPDNNLVPWQARYGKDARPHQPLFESKNRPEQLVRVEEALFKLYCEQQDEQAFVEMVDIFGRQYPLIGYLFFLKDRSKYLPIRPTHFDRVFNYLGADFETSHRCSWNNYCTYVALMGELRLMLAESLGSEVALLDAHSFTWMLSSQLEKEKKLPDVQEYWSFTPSEREAIIKA